MRDKRLKRAFSRSSCTSIRHSIVIAFWLCSSVHDGTISAKSDSISHALTHGTAAPQLILRICLIKRAGNPIRKCRDLVVHNKSINFAKSRQRHAQIRQSQKHIITVKVSSCCRLMLGS